MYSGTPLYSIYYVLDVPRRPAGLYKHLQIDEISRLNLSNIAFSISLYEQNAGILGCQAVSSMCVLLVCTLFGTLAFFQIPQSLR